MYCDTDVLIYCYAVLQKEKYTAIPIYWCSGDLIYYYTGLRIYGYSDRRLYWSTDILLYRYTDMPTASISIYQYNSISHTWEQWERGGDGSDAKARSTLPLRRVPPQFHMPAQRKQQQCLTASARQSLNLLGRSLHARCRDDLDDQAWQDSASLSISKQHAWC